MEGEEDENEREREKARENAVASPQLPWKE
jgi:hypothetical protein